ncbi:hypothetical protein ACLMJK_002699 [Lecanora helva]
MAPSRTKKRKSSAENGSKLRLETVILKSPMRTPVHSPQKKVVSITEAQKQALIDNLQLEVTERARKLRAQYALQAQSLRTRIELRINRIPNALRKANMGELFEKYREISEKEQKTIPQVSEPTELENAPPVPEKPATAPKVAATTASTNRGLKRNSDAMEPVDKENLSEPTHDIPNPKKRTKVAKGPSRQITNPSTVLSPKSANSRTLPQSPVRPPLGPPQKSNLSHPELPSKPFSPVKAASPAKAAAAVATTNLAAMIEKPKTGRPKAGTASNSTSLKAAPKSGTLRAKRGATQAQETDVRKVSNTSNISSASNATIVKTGKKASAVSGKKNEVGIRAAGKKVAAPAEVPPPGRRVLRKRA